MGAPPSNRMQTSQQSLRGRLRRGGLARFTRSHVANLRNSFHRHPRGENLSFPSDMNLELVFFFSCKYFVFIMSLLFIDEQQILARVLLW